MRRNSNFKKFEEFNVWTKIISPSLFACWRKNPPQKSQNADSNPFSDHYVTKPFSNENIEARVEVINKYQSILLDGEITENLRTLVSKHPLGREILASSEFNNISIPLMTVNSLSAQNGSSIIENGSSIINDEDLADTLFADSPEYTGLADLDFKIIEPSGIDLPTRVYSNPEEAVQLHKFAPHIRPFIREIFIEK